MNSYNLRPGKPHLHEINATCNYNSKQWLLEILVPVYSSKEELEQLFTW